ncbi:MAG: N-alpha-acetyl-L-2,4-diaminobutyrate deacetylase [Verrucomicrobiales bacterium]|jgi:N-alpha-acetyl-L-2,4-diaminobutyrate deacetylase
MQDSPVTPTVPFDQDGLHTGFLKVPHSHDGSAYGAVMVPVAVIKNGEGPTVLLTGGNHGDEYQGPLAMIRLVSSINVSEVTGRIIVVPTMNQPAFAAGTRTSPIDKGNLNRMFPGRPDGTITEKIADYMARYMLPMADLVMDMHDGGKTLEFIPMACTHVLDDPVAEEKGWRFAEAFKAPFTCKLVEIDTIGMWDTHVEESGTPFVTTELGGTGTTRPDWAEIGLRGVKNVLKEAGALTGEQEDAPTQFLDVPLEGAYITSDSDGLIEWVVALGEPITKGQVIARVHDPVHLGSEPKDYHATMDGVLAMRHFPGIVRLGDSICMQATIVEPS